MPAGSSAMGTWLPAMPFTTSLMVPSPPQSDDHASPLRHGVAGHLRGGSAGRGRGEFGGDARVLQDSRGLLDFAEAAMAFAAAGRVVDENARP